MKIQVRRNRFAHGDVMFSYNNACIIITYIKDKLRPIISPDLLNKIVHERLYSLQNQVYDFGVSKHFIDKNKDVFIKINTIYNRVEKLPNTRVTVKVLKKILA